MTRANAFSLEAMKETFLYLLIIGAYFIVTSESSYLLVKLKNVIDEPEMKSAVNKTSVFRSKVNKKNKKGKSRKLKSDILFLITVNFAYMIKATIFCFVQSEISYTVHSV